MMTASEFIEKAKQAASAKTLYVMGAWGVPMNDKNKARWAKAHNFNVGRIENASPDTFGFDCVNLVKGILWGWNADASKVYGGAEYESNNVPDATISTLLNTYCTDVSSDFSKIVPGEFVVFSDSYGHCGIYIGDGLIVESTPIWENGVQTTVCKNISIRPGNGRTWWKHGKLKFVQYDEPKETPTMVCPCCGAKFIKL